MKILFCLLLCSCVGPSYQDKIYKCMDKVIGMGGNTTESYDICQKMLSGRQK